MSEQSDSARLRGVEMRQAALSEELEVHCEQLDDDHERLTRLEWITVGGIAWLTLITCLVVWGVMR
jgi:hypothetical protein